MKAYTSHTSLSSINLLLFSSFLPQYFFLYAWLIFSMDWGNFHATKLYMEWKSYVELLDFNQFCLAIKSHFNYCHFLSVLNLSTLSKTWLVISYFFLTFKSFSSILFFFINLYVYILHFPLCILNTFFFFLDGHKVMSTCFPSHHLSCHLPILC